MAIRLQNTLTRTKDLLVPGDPDRVTMYVCGPTVYSRAHIGNARPAVVFDVLQRLLRHEYGADHVVYARNITDIDDRIIAESATTGVPIGEITARTEGWYLADMGALGVQPPDIAPHATMSVPAMVAMMEVLIAKGHAYAAEGHVLFDVASDPGYGSLSRRPLDEMIAGARVEVAPYKRNPADFVLWKPSTAEQPGWASPWGRGRPGWHIECSAMIVESLGTTIDIHLRA
jgi:cysteinyl-tRNA synthetase